MKLTEDESKALRVIGGASDGKLFVIAAFPLILLILAGVIWLTFRSGGEDPGVSVGMAIVLLVGIPIFPAVRHLKLLRKICGELDTQGTISIDETGSKAKSEKRR